MDLINSIFLVSRLLSPYLSYTFLGIPKINIHLHLYSLYTALNNLIYYVLAFFNIHNNQCSIKIINMINFYRAINMAKDQKLCNEFL